MRGISFKGVRDGVRDFEGESRRSSRNNRKVEGNTKVTDSSSMGMSNQPGSRTPGFKS